MEWPQEVVSCKVVVITLRNLSNNSIIKVRADRLSNPSIAIRRDPPALASEIHLADSPFFRVYAIPILITPHTLGDLEEILFLKGFMTSQLERQEKGELRGMRSRIK